MKNDCIRILKTRSFVFIVNKFLTSFSDLKLKLFSFILICFVLKTSFMITLFLLFLLCLSLSYVLLHHDHNILKKNVYQENRRLSL